MSTSADRFRKVDAIFDAVLDAADAEQEATARRLCAGDAGLLDEVLGLLRAYRKSTTFLEVPERFIPPELLELEPARPERIGPFRIVKGIGRGGMGTVYLGERDDGNFEQRVAVKLIRHGTPSVVRRFVEERRILARLEHPFIARLIDGGVVDGQPWFAMEVVEGEPVDVYCDTHNLGVEERVRLFQRVCDAIGYAHRYLVIHRDLKPSNILVTADGDVKLLDFGIATLADPVDGAGRTELHALTPEFAAPEQLRGGAVTTAADVYSLGVLLYVLLAGVRPYEVRGLSAAEAERVITGTEPRAPSECAAPERAELLRGDLDVIVMKALRKDADRRYATVQELGEDLERHLDGRPVHARPLTWSYQLGRFLRRHRGGAVAVGAIVFLIISYAASMTVQQVRVRRALAEAETNAEKAAQVTEFMLGMFQASDRGAGFGDTLTARELLNRGTARARDLSGQPAVRAQMLDVIGHLHMQLGEYDRALSVYREALADRRSALDEMHADIGTSLAHVAAATRQLGDIEGALNLRREALRIRRAALGERHAATLETLYWVAYSLHEAGRSDEAWPLFAEWRAGVEAYAGPATAAHATQLINVGNLLLYRGDVETAKRLITEAVRIRRVIFGERHAYVARALSSLAYAHMSAREMAEAERLERESVAMLRSIYPDGHPDLADGVRNLAVALHRQGKAEEAERLYLEHIELVQRYFGHDHLSAATAAEDLGLLYHRTRRYSQAEPLLRDAVRLYAAHAGPESLLTRRAGVILGDVLRRRGATAEAEPLLVAGFDALSERRVPGFDYAVRIAARALTEMYGAQGRVEESARYRAVAAAQQ